MTEPGAAHIWLARPQHQASELASLLAAQGYEPIIAPVLEIKPLAEGTPLLAAADRELCSMEAVDHLIFVSANAAEIGLRRLHQLGQSLPAALTIYAVGPSTAARLQSLGRSVVVPASDFTSEGLLAVHQLQDVESNRVLIVRGVGGRSLLADELGRRGADVRLAEMYRREKPGQLPAELVEALNTHTVCATLVASGETLENLVDLAAGWLPHLRTVPMVVPGERVGKLARQHGFEQVCLARSAVTEDMLEALVGAGPGDSTQGSDKSG